MISMLPQSVTTPQVSPEMRFRNRRLRLLALMQGCRCTTFPGMLRFLHLWRCAHAEISAERFAALFVGGCHSLFFFRSSIARQTSFIRNSQDWLSHGFLESRTLADGSRQIPETCGDQCQQLTDRH